MKRYFSSIKQYLWIPFVCMLIAALGGFVLAKAQPTVYQVSSIMLVDVGAPGTTFSATGASSPSAAGSLTTAANYSIEIQTRSVMQFVYQSDPKIAQRGYTADDLLADVVPVASTTSPTITITAISTSPRDGVLLANDVANGFQNYVQTQLQQHLDTLRGNLQSQITLLQAQNNKLEGQIQALNNPTDPRTATWTTDRNDIIHNLDALQSQLQSLPTTIHSDVFTVQQAELTDAQSGAKTSNVIAATAGVGLLLGLVIMLLLIFLDSRLRSEEQVKEKLGLAYLGGITSNKKLGQAPMSVKGTIVQDLVDIWANLHLTGVLENGLRAPHGAVLLITSPHSSEGKTTLTAAFSATIARGGGSVVVVDGNIRQPSTHLAFGIKPAGMGLSGLLRGTAQENVGDAVIRSNVPGVWLLPGGVAVEESAFLIEQKMPGILAQLRQKTDLVIIDGPALLNGSDASLLASMADGVALVVDVRHDKLPQLLRTKELLLSLTHTPAGVLMNRLSRRGRNHYYASVFPTSKEDYKDWVSVPASNGNGKVSANGERVDRAIGMHISLPVSQREQSMVKMSTSPSTMPFPAGQMILPSMPIEPSPAVNGLSIKQQLPGSLSIPGNRLEMYNPSANEPRKG